MGPRRSRGNARWFRDDNKTPPPVWGIEAETAGFTALVEAPSWNPQQPALPRHRRFGRRHAILGYNLYQERKQPDGMQINVGPGGISIEKK